MKYTCECGYQWTSRKEVGAPCRCPNCSGRSISPLVPTVLPGAFRRVQLPSEAYDKDGNIIFQKSEMQPPYPPLNGEKSWRYQKEENSDPVKIEQMKELTEKIRERLKKQHP